MANSIIFKRVFEIQLLQDYYLAMPDGTSFFDLNKEEKDLLISNKQINGLYDIRKQFTIEPDRVTKINLSKNKLIWKPTALGFIIGTEVSVENQMMATLYKPKYELKTSLSFSFLIQPQVPFFKGINNISLRPSLPAKYYFTNKGKSVFNEPSSTDVSLPISNTIGVYQAGKRYEMGAMVNFDGALREALIFTDGNATEDWADIEDRRWVSDFDRLLLPHRFDYRLKSSFGITNLDIALLDQGNVEIKTIKIEGTENLNNVAVDLSVDNDNTIIPKGFYTLKVVENAGSEILYPIYLNTTLYEEKSWGVIEISLDETNSPYGLIDTNGYLKTRITTQKITHPIFEIRLKNRKTYWRYRKEQGAFSDDETTGTNAHLTPTDGNLVSNDPKGLTKAFGPFKKGDSQLLPYPHTPTIRIEGGKMFSEIYINPSNRIIN